MEKYGRPRREPAYQYQPMELYISSQEIPGLYQSYGLGFFEYFQLSEDIGAEPLPVLNCGLSCQFENEGMDHMCR